MGAGLHLGVEQVLKVGVLAFAAEMPGGLPRKDQRAAGELYVRGLLADGRRKSMQPMAARLEVDHQRLQQRPPGFLAAGLPFQAATRSHCLRARRRRARHDDVLAMVARPGPAGVRLIDDEHPAVYCLPGRGRIVMTTGALRCLDDRQLEAVLAHERAHLSGRHHLVLTFASALQEAFPADVPVPR